MISDYQTNNVSKLNKKSRFWTVCLLTFSILNTPKLQYSNKKGFEPQWFRCSLYLNLIKICITGVVHFYHYSGTRPPKITASKLFRFWMAFGFQVLTVISIFRQQNADCDLARIGPVMLRPQRHRPRQKTDWRNHQGTNHKWRHTNLTLNWHPPVPCVTQKLLFYQQL